MTTPDSAIPAPPIEPAAPKSDPSGPQNIAIELEVDHSGNTVFIRGTLVPETKEHPIVLVHDFGESGSLYREATRDLTERGFSAISFDMRGHGRSGNRLGYFEHYSLLISDLLQVAAWIRHKSDGKAPVIICQGASAAIGVSFCLRHPRLCHALVLCAPVFKPKTRLSRSGELFVKAVSDMFPYSRLPGRLVPLINSEVKFGGPGHIHQEKPELTIVYTSTYVRQLLELLENAPARFLRLKSPTLIIRSPSDDITDYRTLLNLLKRHKRRQFVKEVVVEDQTHHLLTETHDTLVATLNIVQAWLAKVAEEAHD